VWARGGVVSLECPKSYVSAESVSWVEEYVAWRMSGRQALLDLPARTAEAFLVLDREWRTESDHEAE